MKKTMFKKVIAAGVVAAMVMGVPVGAMASTAEGLSNSGSTWTDFVKGETDGASEATNNITNGVTATLSFNTSYEDDSQVKVGDVTYTGADKIITAQNALTPFLTQQEVTNIATGEGASQAYQNALKLPSATTQAAGAIGNANENIISATTFKVALPTATDGTNSIVASSADITLAFKPSTTVNQTTGASEVATGLQCNAYVTLVGPNDANGNPTTLDLVVPDIAITTGTATLNLAKIKDATGVKVVQKNASTGAMELVAITGAPAFSAALNGYNNAVVTFSLANKTPVAVPTTAPTNIKSAGSTKNETTGEYTAIIETEPITWGYGNGTTVKVSAVTTLNNLSAAIDTSKGAVTSANSVSIAGLSTPTAYYANWLAEDTTDASTVAETISFSLTKAATLGADVKGSSLITVLVDSKYVGNNATAFITTSAGKTLKKNYTVTASADGKNGVVTIDSDSFTTYTLAIFNAGTPAPQPTPQPTPTPDPDATPSNPTDSSAMAVDNGGKSPKTGVVL